VHPSFVALVPECRIDRVYCVSQRTNAARQSLQCIGSLLNGHQSVKMQFLDLLPLTLSQISPYSLGQVKLCSAYHKQCTRFQLVSIWGGFWSQKASLGTGCTRWCQVFPNYDWVLSTSEHTTEWSLVLHIRANGQNTIFSHGQDNKLQKSA